MKGEPQKFGVQAVMEQWGPTPLTFWAARQVIYHVHLFMWDLQGQVAQMLSFEPYLKDSCLQQHPALHRLRMSVVLPGRGWAAKRIPAATSDFSSFANFVPPADFTAVKPLLPFGCFVPVSPRQTCACVGRQSQAESLGEGPRSRRLRYSARPAICLCGLWQLTPTLWASVSQPEKQDDHS